MPDVNTDYFLCINFNISSTSIHSTTRKLCLILKSCLQFNKTNTSVLYNFIMTKSFIFSYYNAELKVSDWSFEMKNNIQVYNVITVGTSGSSSLIKELCIDHVKRVC